MGSGVGSTTSGSGANGDCSTGGMSANVFSGAFSVVGGVVTASSCRGPCATSGLSTGEATASGASSIMTGEPLSSSMRSSALRISA